MVLLTEADPGGELAEGCSIWVVAFGVKLFKAYINEGLQHGQSCLGAWLSPLRLSNCFVNLQGGQGFVPVYLLYGKGGRKEENSAEVTGDSKIYTANFKRGEESSEPFT